MRRLLRKDRLRRILRRALSRGTHLSGCTVSGCSCLFHYAQLLSVERLLSIICVFSIYEATRQMTGTGGFYFAPAVIRAVRFSIRNVMRPFIRGTRGGG